MAAALLSCAVPAIAAAETFGVNTTADAGNPLTPCNGVEECTLRQAIELADANGDGGVDTITFTAVPAGQHELSVESPLPAITEALRIEGDTAPGATAGVPALELVPIGIATREGAGLRIIGTNGTRIEGLAIGGFATGIEIAPEEGEPPLETQICGDYIGTEWLGESARPNKVGVEIRNEGTERPEKTEIGGSGCAGNVISGNSVDGVSDSGLETTIAGSRIGLGANPGGASLGNGTVGEAGSAGILETAAASHTLIGGVGGLNNVDDNKGPGVLVAKGGSQVTIRGNSFSENEGKGIEILEEAPPAPAIASAASAVTHEVTIAGTVEATTPGEGVQLDFFASNDCSAAGEGRTFLGSELIEDVSGPTAYEVTLPVEVPADEHGITATATREAGATSEFSACATYAGAPRTLHVTTTEDLLGGECGATCSLREAIEVANETETKDTIEFDVAGTIEATVTQLPELHFPVEISGTTAPGYAGKPVVEIKGPEVVTTFGLWLGPEAAGSTVSGLAIGGFGVGVVLEGDDQRICGSYLGVEADGTTALPNQSGVELVLGRAHDEVGAGCELLGDGNLISGNAINGILDFGTEPEIAGNHIGIDAQGAALANGNGDPESAGIAVSPQAAGAIIGSIGLEPGNVIVDNRGPGVLVSRTLTATSIRGNSIYLNAARGIEIAELSPALPVVSKVEPAADTLTVEGEATAAGAETIELDFFASESCSAATRGGQTFLGSDDFGAAGGATTYTAELDGPLPAGENYVTATATGSVLGQTTEFSECFHFEAPPPGEQTFTVSGLENTGGAAGCEDESAATECTLRGAIEAANKSEALDTIDFAETAEGTIEALNEFRIEDPIDIDGTSAPGYDGEPIVQIKGPNLTTRGLYLTPGAAGSTISGLAVGGFQIGVALEGDDQRVCGSYLGVGLDGTTAVPNRVGVSIEEDATGDQVGAGCEAAGDGNLISGNTFGITDFGSQTVIAANRIGIDANGAALPNGESHIEGAGITVEHESTAAIGPAGLEGANTIAHNFGPGILVARPSSKAAIHGNPIFDNELQGIQSANEESVPPKVTKVRVGSDSLTIEGEATAAGAETIELDFFASPACSVPGGQTFLGQRNVSGVAGTNDFEAELAGELPTGEEFVTVTSTGSVGGQTTEFSECFRYVAPPEPRTFTVDSLEDVEGPAGCEDGSEATECTLRGAIEAANETEARDTIDFAAGGEGVIHVADLPLPDISAPVHIDGASAPGWFGEPKVEIDGTGATNEGPVRGLEVTAGETTIEGLAIGGFSTAAVSLGGEGGSQVCSSWVGIGLGGANLPNGTGVDVEEGSADNTVGGSCHGVVYNYISANQGWGIEDLGRETQVGYNNIGISPLGAADGNGEGGILVGEAADGPRIGSSLGGAPGPNDIAYNGGPGVRVETGASRATIRGNSIFGNAGKGIAIGKAAPAVPTIEAVESGSGTITVKGAVTSSEEEPIELEVFASAVCSPLTAGEGESFLGHAEIALSNPGSNPIVGTVAAPASDDQIYITVTATAALGRRTSEFSECFKYVPPEPEPEPEHHEETKPPAQNSATTPPVTPTLDTTPEFTPTNGEKVVVKPEEGKVKIKLPGTNKSEPLEELKEIPVGAVIDATKGRVTLTSVGPDGKEQTAEFFDGLFKVKQAEGANMVVLELLDTGVCPAPKAKRAKNGKGKGSSPRAFASSVSLRPGTATTGKLWGSGHGNFRTEGHDGSATVRGTMWLVEDRCNGTTFFKTRRGIVSVRDFLLHKTLPLPAGKSYVAGEE